MKIKNADGLLAGLALLSFGLLAHGATAVHIPARVHSPSGRISLTSEQRKTLTASQISSTEKDASRGIVSTDRKTLTFRQKKARLVVQTGPENDMLSYRIDGLRNPTLVVPQGATLRVFFLNTDNDMDHNIRFGGWHRSYPNDATGLLKSSVGTPPLPHKTETAIYAEDLTLHVPKTSGKYAYFCTVRGHAQGGMWGTILVQ